MLQIIKHRVNRSEDLVKMDPAWGAEIDLRSVPLSAGKLHLAHDPWAEGECFAKWLTEYRRLQITGPLIVNTKEDGLEKAAFGLLSDFGIENFFFLDTTLPTLFHWTLKMGEPRFAVRLSSIETLSLTLAGKAQWLWVDCFDGIALAPEILASAKKHFQICLVSPELQGSPTSEIASFQQLKPFADAVCTKVPELWR